MRTAFSARVPLPRITAGNTCPVVTDRSSPAYDRRSARGRPSLGQPGCRRCAMRRDRPSVCRRAGRGAIYQRPTANADTRGPERHRKKHPVYMDMPFRAWKVTARRRLLRTSYRRRRRDSAVSAACGRRVSAAEHAVTDARLVCSRISNVARAITATCRCAREYAAIAAQVGADGHELFGAPSPGLLTEVARVEPEPGGLEATRRIVDRGARPAGRFSPLPGSVALTVAAGVEAVGFDVEALAVDDLAGAVRCFEQGRRDAWTRRLLKRRVPAVAPHARGNR